MPIFQEFTWEENNVEIKAILNSDQLNEAFYGCVHKDFTFTLKPTKTIEEQDPSMFLPENNLQKVNFKIGGECNVNSERLIYDYDFV